MHQHRRYFTGTQLAVNTGHDSIIHYGKRCMRETDHRLDSEELYENWWNIPLNPAEYRFHLCCIMQSRFRTRSGPFGACQVSNICYTCVLSPSQRPHMQSSAQSFRHVSFVIVGLIDCNDGRLPSSLHGRGEMFPDWPFAL